MIFSLNTDLIARNKESGILRICDSFLVIGSRIHFPPMNTLIENDTQIPFIRELCKHKTEEEIREAEENFRRYLLLIKSICERLEREEDALLENVDKPEEYCDSEVHPNFD